MKGIRIFPCHGYHRDMNVSNKNGNIHMTNEMIMGWGSFGSYTARGFYDGPVEFQPLWGLSDCGHLHFIRKYFGGYGPILLVEIASWMEIQSQIPYQPAKSQLLYLALRLRHSVVVFMISQGTNQRESKKTCPFLTVMNTHWKHWRNGS